MKAPKKRPVCFYCQKKLKVYERTAYVCRCKRAFCALHRLQADHNCTYNFKRDDKKVLKEQLQKCVAKKVNFL